MTDPLVGPTARSLPDSPWRGLVPYSEADAAFFFGREEEVAVVIDNLMAWPLTLLYGPGGVGKSSLLEAGVARTLLEQARRNIEVRGTPELVPVVFRDWSGDPVVDLLRKVSDTVGALTEGWPELDSREWHLDRGLRACTDSFGGELLVILDQFEEYFVYHANDDGAGTFVDELPRVLHQRDQRVSFLLSLRDDALAELDRFAGRVPQLFERMLRIEALDRESARAAIELPLQRYNQLQVGDEVELEAELVDAVLEEAVPGRIVLGGAGVRDGSERIEAAHLQMVMTRLWEEERRRGSRTLRLATLKELGGAERLIRTQAEEALSRLSTGDRAIVAEILRYLVAPSGAKIAHSAPDLSVYTDVPEAQLVPVLERLAGGDVRLLRSLAPPPDHPEVGVRYEIFHDLLAPSLLDWRQRYLLEGTRRRAFSTRLTRLAALASPVLLVTTIVLAVLALFR